MSLNGLFNSYIPLTNTTSLTASNVINAGSVNVSNNLTLSYVDPNSILTTDSNKKVITKTLNDGQLLIGKNNDEPQIKGITGTNKQILITHNPNDITFSTPQDLDLDSTPTFNNIRLDGLTGPYLVATDNSNNLQSLTTSSNNGVISGITGSNLIIDTPQDIRTTSSPTFNNINVNNIDCASILSTGDIKSNTNIVGNQLVATGLTSNRLVGVGTGGALQSLTTSSNNGVIVGLTGSSLIIDTPQDIRTTSSPSFNGLTVSGMNASNRLMGTNSSKNVVATGISNSNGNYVTYNNGLLTCSLAQNIQPIATPSFAGLFLNNITTDCLLGAVGPYGELKAMSTTSSNGVTATVSGTTLTINTPQDIRTTSNVVFNQIHSNTYISASSVIGAEQLFSNTFIHLNGAPYFGYIAIGEPSGNSGGNVLIDVIKPGINQTIYRYTVPNAGTDADFVMTAGNQTIGGSKQFSTNLIPSTTATYDIGSTSNRWRNIYLGRSGGTADLGVASNGQASLNLYSDSSTTEHINFGSTGSGSKWHFSSRTSTENNEFRFFRGPGLGTGYDQIMTFTGSGTNEKRVTFNQSMDSSATNNGSVVFNGGVGIAKKLNVGSLAINGTDVNLSNLVTTNTTQTISGQKTFTSDILVGSGNEGILRLSTYDVGQNRIKGGYVDDTNHYLEFYCRNDLVARFSQGYVGSGRDRWTDLYGPLRFVNGGGSHLNYYKEHSYSTYFIGGGGSISANVNATIKCIRIGKNVTVDVLASTSNFLATGGNPNLVVNTPINAEFRPITSHRFGAAIVNNNNTLFIQAMTEVNYAGYIYVAPAPNGYFVGGLGSSNNIRPFSLTYNIN